MIKTVNPAFLKGTIAAPASKSYMQRAVAAALLSEGTTTILNPSFCDDSLRAIDIAKTLGAKVNNEDNRITIVGGLKATNNTINCGEAGLSLRMFTPIAALLNKPITINGEGSLKTRPLPSIDKPIKQLGASIKTNNGFIPVEVCGPLQGGKANVDGSMSSQFLTGLLMALPLAKNNSTIVVNNLKSTPYIDVTLDVLNSFGIEVINNNYTEFFIEGNQKYKPQTYTIESDWSSLSLLLVAGAINGDITITNVSINSKQADIAILEALKRAGVNIVINNTNITVNKSNIVGFNFDATHCPDLFPPLAALAAVANGKSVIKGVSRLKHKESDRALAIVNEFSKLGVECHVNNDDLIIEGGKIVGNNVDSHNDHRIAMALSCLSLVADKPVIISNAECVAKSYPNFFHDIENLYGM